METGPRRILHSGDRAPAFAGVGNPGDVPYYEALAFWGWAVEQRIVPRSYTLAVLCEHPLMFTNWWGELAGRWDRVCVAADDLADWLDVVMSESITTGQSFWDYLQAESDFRQELRALPTKIAACQERMEAERHRGPPPSARPTPSPKTRNRRPDGRCPDPPPFGAVRRAGPAVSGRALCRR